MTQGPTSGPSESVSLAEEQQGPLVSPEDMSIPNGVADGPAIAALVRQHCGG